MADFDTWKYSSLVEFAKDSTARIAELEAENAELAKDRKELLDELRKLLRKEAACESTHTRRAI